MSYIPNCLLCTKYYKKDDRCSIIPYLLSCVHSICNLCLQKISQPNSVYITCPICSVKTQLKAAGEWKSLPKDIYAHGLILISKSMPIKDLEDSLLNFAYKAVGVSPKKYICIECGHDATCRCNKCEDVFCGSCFDKYHQGNSTKKHQARPLDADTSLDLETKLMCQKHAKNKLSLFCIECSEAICAACVTDDHSSHNCVTIAEKNKNNLELIDEYLKVGLVQECISRESKKDISSLINVCSKKQASLISSLNDKFHLLYSALQLKQIEFHELIRKNMILEKQKLEQLDQNLIHVASELTNIFKYVMKKKRNYEIIPIDMDDVKQKFDDIYKKPSKANINKDEFIHDYDINDMLLLNAISSIEVLIKNPQDITLEIFTDQPDFVLEKKNKLSHNCIEELGNRLGMPKSRPIIMDLHKSYIKDNESEKCDSSRSRNSSMQSLHSNSSSSIPVGRIPPSRNLSFKNEIFQVSVKYVQNPCHFSVQFVKDLQIIDQLTNDIKHYCYLNYKKYKTISEVPEGGWILANYKGDNNWYRAKIINIKPVEKIAEIYYLDYGNTDKVPFSKLMKIPNHLSVHRPLAHLCSLVDIVPANRESTWKLEASEIFHRIVSTKIMTMHVLEIKNDLLMVDLSAPIAENIENDGPASLRDIFVFLGLACFDTEHSRPLEFSSQRHYGRFTDAKLPEVNSNVNIVLTHVENPDKFFIQIVTDEVQEFKNLCLEMQSVYESTNGDQYDLLCPSIGNICVAKYSLDGKWYRAVVLELCSEGNVKVKYVDFGNEEILSVFRIKKIIDRHHNLPAMAIECKCADSRPVDNNDVQSWENKATEILTEMIDKINVSMRIINVDEECRVLTVYVSDNNSVKNNVEELNVKSIKPPSSVSAQFPGIWTPMSPKSIVLEKNASMTTYEISKKKKVPTATLR